MPKLLSSLEGALWVDTAQVRRWPHCRLRPAVRVESEGYIQAVTCIIDEVLVQQGGGQASRMCHSLKLVLWIVRSEV